MEYPFTAIGLIISKFPSNQQGKFITKFGTGFLIHDNIVLTCGHNVYDKDTNKMTIQSNFYPGLNGNIQNASFCSIGYVFVPQQYKTLEKNQEYIRHDFALLVISKKSIVKQYGYFPFNDENIKNGDQIFVYGYQNKIQKPNEQFKLKGDVNLYGCNGYICNVDQQRIYHSAFTSPGQSGSPIFRKAGKNYQFIGIHTHKSNQYNAGIKMNLKLLMTLNKWVKLQKEDKQKCRILPQNLMQLLKISNDRFVKDYRLGQSKGVIDPLYEEKLFMLKDQNQLFLEGQKSQDIGFYERALRYKQKYFNIIVQKYSDDDIRYARALAELGSVNYHQKKYIISQQITHKLIPILTKIKQKKNQVYAQILNFIGLNFSIELKHNDALKIHNEQLSIIQQIYGKFHFKCVLPMISIGNIYLTLEKIQQSSKYFQRCQHIIKQNHKENTLQNVKILHGFAFISLKLHRYQDTLQKYNQSLKIIQKIYGEKSVEAIKIIINIGICYFKQGKLINSFKQLKKARYINEYIYGKNHISQVNLLGAFGNIYRELGKFDEANSYYEQMQKLVNNSVLENHQQNARLLSNVAVIYLNRGKQTQAIILFQKSLKILESCYGKNSIKCTGIKGNIANLYQRTNQNEQALKIYQQISKILEQKLGQQSDYLAYTLINIGTLHLDQNTLQIPLKNFEKALKISQNIYGKNHINSVKALTNMGFLYTKRQQYTLALQIFDKCLSIIKQTYGENHISSLHVLDNIATNYFFQGKWQQALNYHLLQLPIYEKVYKKQNIKYSYILLRIGYFYQQLQKITQALYYYQKVLTIYHQNSNFFLKIQNKQKQIQSYIKTFYIKRLIFIKNVVCVSSIVGQIYSNKKKYNIQFKKFIQKFNFIQYLQPICFIGNSAKKIYHLIIKIANFYKFKQDYKNAFYYFQKAYKMMKLQKIYKYQRKSCIQMLHCLFKNKQFDQMRKYLKVIKYLDQKNIQNGQYQQDLQKNQITPELIYFQTQKL